jgi:RNA polymerase sigma-70 factor (ECF subfamily)
VPSDQDNLKSALLTVRWQRGDRKAFEEIVALWERSLFYYLRRLAPTEADAWELLQETWMKAFRALKTLRDPQALPAFLYATARNLALSRLRRNELESGVPADGAALADDGDVPAFDDAEQVHHALDQLPLLQREALTLFFLHDLCIDEMASLLEVPVGTVKSRLHYARIAIRKILSQGDTHAR